MTTRMMALATLVAVSMATTQTRLSVADAPPIFLYSFFVLGGPQGIDVALDGSLRIGVDMYITHYGANGGLVHFNNPGFCSAGFSYPSGVAVAPDNRVYVADQDLPFCVTIFDAGLNTIGGLADTTIETGLFWGPHDVAIAADGGAYVSDVSHDRIWRFDSAGTLLGWWGEAGAGPGQLSSPTGVGVDAEGFVYVADTGNRRVQRFTASGDYVEEWNSPNLRDLDTTMDGFVYTLAASLEVRKYDSSGTLIWEYTDGVCGSPSICIALNLAASESGLVFISNTSNGSVTVLGPPPVQTEASTWGRVKAMHR